MSDEDRSESRAVERPGAFLEVSVLVPAVPTPREEERPGAFPVVAGVLQKRR